MKSKSADSVAKSFWNSFHESQKNIQLPEKMINNFNSYELKPKFKMYENVLKRGKQ